MEIEDYQSMDKFQNPYAVRCIVIGDHNVGKSTMTNVFSTGEFKAGIPSTIGIAFVSKDMQLVNYNNHKVKLQVWDTAGSEKFKSIVRSYLRDAYIALLVFDVTDRESWDHLEEWRQDLLDHKKYNSLPHIIVVGTKSDLPNWAVTMQDMRKRGKEWDCKVYSVSSKQSNSSGMIYRIFSIGLEDMHEKLTHDHTNGIEIPKEIYKKKNFFNLDSDETKTNWCCYQ